MYYNDDNELYHWGVKGMRWGRRKAKQTSESSKSVSSNSSKSVSSNSEVEELRRQINSMQKRRAVGAVAKLAGVSVAAVAAYPIVRVGAWFCKGVWTNNWD